MVAPIRAVILAALWLAVSASLIIDIFAPSLAGQDALKLCLLHFFQLLLVIALVFNQDKQSKAPIESRLLVIENQVESLRNELAVAKSKELAIVENAVDVIGLIDTNSRFVSLNPAAKSVLGYDAAELVGRPITEFIFVEDLETTLSAMVGAETSIEKILFECRWRRKDGEIIDLLWSCHWSAGDRGLFCVIHDITRRKQVEKALRESEERIRLIMESLPIALFMTNKVGLIEMINSQAEKICGHLRSELAGRSFHMVAPELLKVDSASAFMQLFIDLSRHQRESSLTRKNGQPVPVEFSMTELTVQGQKKYVIAAVDITERYEIDKTKREFMAMVSHDLKSPLSNILVTLGLFADGKLGELDSRANTFITQAYSETKRLNELIKDLLDLEKMTDTKYAVHFEKVSLAKVVGIALNAVRSSAEIRQITIESPAVDLACEGDSARLVQVIVNLLSNAIKFSPAGSTIRISFQESEVCAKVLISDSGRGIPADKQEKIFEKFIQVEESDWKIEGGTGLGLAICKTIIEQHGGTIKLDSTPGVGSTFWFEIPKVQSG